MKLNEFAMNRRTADAAIRRTSGALVGFEFEFALQKTSDLYDPGQTTDYVELRRLDLRDLDDLSRYFDIGFRTSSMLEREYLQWKAKKEEEWIDENWWLYAPTDKEEEDEDAAEIIGREEAKQRVEDKIDVTHEQWMDDEYGDVYHMLAQNGIAPLYGWHNDTGNDRATVFIEEPLNFSKASHERVAQALTAELGWKAVQVDGSRQSRIWQVTDDGSIEGGIGTEIISPPMMFEDARSVVLKMARFARKHDLETNISTGLHINVSTPWIRDNFDIVKFILFLGDEAFLDRFDRSASIYTPSQLRAMITGIRNELQQGGRVRLDDMKHLHSIAKSYLRTRKYASVNISKLVEYGYLEIRIAGGEYLEKVPDVLMFLDTIIVAMQIASDPQMERQNYLKKLYKLLSRAVPPAPPASPAKERLKQKGFSTSS